MISDHSSPRRFSHQRGSVIVISAIVMFTMIILIAAADLGYLFYAKRELQKAADLAALTGIKQLATSCSAAQAAASTSVTNNSQSLSFSPSTAVTCGKWDKTYTAPSYFSTTIPSGQQANAIQVVVTSNVPIILPFMPNSGRILEARAIAKSTEALAALTVRSTLIEINTDESTLLNSIVGGLLGGNINLTAVSWNGLLTTNINLLSYLDQLAINLNLQAGDYNSLLNTNIAATALIQAAIDALQKNGNTASAAIDGLIGIKAALSSTTLKLADLIDLQTGTPKAGLDLGLQAFQLVQGIVQVANSQHAAVASVAIPIPGIATATVKTTVIEPPQISAIGNPALAAADPYGPNQIFVRTAQIRSLVTVDLPVLSGITGLLNAVTGLLSPVTSLLNNVLSLNLQAILCLGCTQTQIVLVPENPIHLSINLDVASGNARVTNYNCPGSGKKSITTLAQTAAADLRIGQMSPTQEAAIFSSSAIPTLSPIPLLDVETRTCTLILCGSWNKYSRTGLLIKADGGNGVAATNQSYTFNDPPNLNLPPPQYHSFSTTDIISSLSNTLSGVQLQTYNYSSSATNHFGNLIGTATQLVTAAISTVQSIITSLLKPLLDKLVNVLLTTLGIDLAKTEIGANMTCGGEAALVY